MVAGLYTWNTGRFDVFEANPPLVRTVATAPVALCGAKCDWQRYSIKAHERGEWALGSEFVSTNNSENVRRWFAFARWTCIPFVVFGGYVCWQMARELYGEFSGLVASTLWCCSPACLAWGATICPDVAAAAFALWAMFAFRQWLRHPCWDRTVFAGVILGLAELTKFTLLIFYLLVPVLWLLYRLPEHRQMAKRRWGREVIQVSAMLALSVLIINVGYGFKGSFQPLGDYRFRTMMFTGHDSLDTIPPEGANRFTGTWIGKLPVPLPVNMIYGIDVQRLDFERGLPSYLRGEWANHGWWYYYLYALTIKEPLGAWCLMALAIAATSLGRGFSASWRDEMLAIAPGLTILVFVSSQTGFAGHFRYVIPAMPFFFVWASKVGRVFEIPRFSRLRLAMAAMVVLAAVWSVGSSLAVYPHSLSYFNELAVVLPTPADALYPMPLDETEKNHSALSSVISAGPRNGPRHLLDSNIDWGQDLYYLECPGSA